MDVTFIWKLIGSDVFEITMTGFSSYASAKEAWHDLFSVTEDDCEAFSFSLDTSAISYEIKHK